MNGSTFRQPAVRAVPALLALALLVAPSFAQRTAAEVCRIGCEPGQAEPAELRPSCCPKHVSTSPPATPEATGGDDAPAGPAADPDARSCSGCGVRPLISTGQRLTPLGLTPASIFATAAEAPASAAGGVPFAIFHPPRP